VVEPDRLRVALRVTKGELAAASGLSRDAVSKTRRLQAPATQARLREVAEIILTDAATMAAHEIGAADLACAWKDPSARGLKPPSWAITERLVAAGIAGIIVPSFAKGAVAPDINVVFWDWTLAAPHQVRVIDDDQRLPKDASCWR